MPIQREMIAIFCMSHADVTVPTRLPVHRLSMDDIDVVPDSKRSIFYCIIIWEKACN